MASTFFGLEIGRRGLQTHQKALDITGNNMANASTPGYSRQRGEITTTQPFSNPSFNRVYTAGQLGTGVDITSVVRVRDELIDEQIQRESTTSGYWEWRYNMLDEMELIVNEPSDSNIRTAVDQFWVAMQNVADDPTSVPARSTLRQDTLAMTTIIREDYSRFKQLRYDANDRINEQVDKINKIASEIAGLNDQISKVTVMNDNANDLMDKRDLLVQELSEIVNINHYTDKFNSMSITINGVALVNGITTNKIVAVPNYDDNKFSQLRWDFDRTRAVDVNNGSLKGLLQIRDQDLPKILSDLDDFANTLINKVNELHRKGYGLDESTNNDFFSGKGAEDINLSDAIKDQNHGLNRIAASETLSGLPGNSSIISKINDLKHERILTNNTSTMGEFIGALVGELGVKSSTAKLKFDSQKLLIGNLDKRRESVCGVSLDEEMTNMVKFQHGYNAAAKIISTVDEMLDVIINRLKI